MKISCLFFLEQIASTIYRDEQGGGSRSVRVEGNVIRIVDQAGQSLFRVNVTWYVEYWPGAQLFAQVASED
jgi:hypothetical protein